MPNNQFNTKYLAQKTEKKTSEVSKFTGQPLTGKTGRGRPKLKLTTLPNQPTNEKSNGDACNRKLTDFFPAKRRSERKCKKTALEEKQREFENKVLCQVEDGLEVRIKSLQ